MPIVGVDSGGLENGSAESMEAGNGMFGSGAN